MLKILSKKVKNWSLTCQDATDLSTLFSVVKTFSCAAVSQKTHSVPHSGVADRLEALHKITSTFALSLMYAHLQRTRGHGLGKMEFFVTGVV